MRRVGQTPVCPAPDGRRRASPAPTKASAKAASIAWQAAIRPVAPHPRRAPPVPRGVGRLQTALRSVALDQRSAFPYFADQASDAAGNLLGSGRPTAAVRAPSWMEHCAWRVVCSWSS